ncbi:MAG: hypothetical protein ABI662_05845 [Dermatophilaceae bacterium]
MAAIEWRKVTNESSSSGAVLGSNAPLWRGGQGAEPAALQPPDPQPHAAG